MQVYYCDAIVVTTVNRNFHHIQHVLLKNRVNTAESIPPKGEEALSWVQAQSLTKAWMWGCPVNGSPQVGMLKLAPGV